jgi:hypothetical protein
MYKIHIYIGARLVMAIKISLQTVGTLQQFTPKRNGMERERINKFEQFFF